MKPMKTPGVYIVEKNAFPNSVVQVATAVPAFIGYTQIAKNGNKSLRDVPWRISSLSEFHQHFGFGPTPKFNIVKSASMTASTSPLEDGDQTDPLLDVKFSVSGKTGAEEDYNIVQQGNAYALYGAMRLFFQNGGAACYIVSIGSYLDDIDGDRMMQGIKRLIKEPEPTMLVIPETTRLTRSKAVAVQQAMLMHCGEKMKNRFAILDVFAGHKDTDDPGGNPIATFRNDIGINNLDYGSAYYPWVNTSIFQSRDFSYQNLTEDGIAVLKGLLPETVDNDKVKEQITKEIAWLGNMAGADSEKLAAEAASAARNAKAASEAAVAAAKGDSTTAATAAASAAIAAEIAATAAAKVAAAAKEALAAADPTKLAADKTTAEAVAAAKTAYETAAATSATSADAAVKAANEAVEAASAALDASKAAMKDVTNDTLATARTDTATEADAKAKAAETASNTAETDANAAVAAAQAIITASGQAKATGTPGPTSEILDKTLRAITPLYKDIMDEIASRMNCMPPASAMAGVYTSVDASRGVWKAPANVSLNSVTSPLVNIGHDEQEDLNVTPQGKSINAIRPFIGEGVLVWGARTLDGNSLDWRYINVRRTMIMLEESIRLASKAYVFEPNTAGTWVMIKSMIENFLTGIWKQGGLPGSVPADAFSVHVGLGDTMTPVDILEGIMRITVLVAISRPAEFIEITFQQQMQKS